MVGFPLPGCLTACICAHRPSPAQVVTGVTLGLTTECGNEGQVAIVPVSETSFSVTHTTTRCRCCCLPVSHVAPQACELFILDLTLRGWVHAEDSRRRTLQRSDIASTVAHWEVLDFLVSASTAHNSNTLL
jgi:hypothetical protein